MAKILPIILAGGSGTRLWPLSREAYPKQFQRLFGEGTMLQNTAIRLKGIETLSPLILCSEDHRFLVAEQLREAECEWSTIILEPVTRSTAPAIALSAFEAIARFGEDVVLLILASDHIINDVQRFHKAVDRAVSATSERNVLVTFGVPPDRAETGYGYIQIGEKIAEQLYSITRFVEKPNVETAQGYLDSGEYYWNSGMFVFKAQSYLEELERLQPQIFSATKNAASESVKDLDFLRPGKSFLESPSLSIDYAVMEKTDTACVVPFDADWNDVGSWGSVWQLTERDNDNNRFSGDVVSIDTRSSFVHAEDRLIAIIGMENVVVVDTKDALLVSEKSRAQDVKLIVDKLKRDAREEHVQHLRVYRPWGNYLTVDSAPGYQVKKITVNPGASLSLQLHHHRSEHWVVVKGSARVICEGKEMDLGENESTYIPLGQKHRLSNPGQSVLELIEVQVGDLISEEDIVRFEDVYGREN